MKSSKFENLISARLRRAGLRPTQRAKNLLGDALYMTCGVSEALVAMSDEQVRALCSAPTSATSLTACETQSVRLSQRDEHNIDRLVLRFGGLSRSEILRLAVEIVVSGQMPNVIMPQMAPTKDVRQVCGVLRDYVEVLGDAVRCGWPPHFDGESDQRRRKVDAARALFDETLKEFEPKLHLLRVMLAATTRLTQADLKQLRDSCGRVLNAYEDAATRAKDPARTPDQQEVARSALLWIKPLIDLLQDIGLVEVQ